MKPGYRYLILGIITIFLLYHSVYFKALDEVVAAKEQIQFNPELYARKAWTQLMKVAPEQAVPIEELLSALRTSPAEACASYGQTLGISNKCYVLLKGEGLITVLEEEGVLLDNADAGYQVRIATEFIFGNILREASGQVPVSDFASIMDFNQVAEAMNKTVQEEVVPAFLAQAKAGKQAHFIGVTAIRKDQAFSGLLDLIPISTTY